MAASKDVGFLHPGLMGESLVANCTETCLWVGDGRSAETRARAEHRGMTEVDTLAALCERADVIVSICPPAAADDVSQQVADCGFLGVYVDANAISPELARAIAGRFDHFVDGSVIGPPAHHEGTTRLYLAGDAAADVAAVFAGGVLDSRVLAGDVGAASALKMAYASWTKIGSALHLAVRALAEAEGVAGDLVAEWDLSQPGMSQRSHGIAAGVGPKAWRFTGEMEQMVDAYEACELPTGFAEAATEIYRRLSGLKGADAPSLDEVLDRLS
jgi:3-hydroxyisobutyrate dehydrogenase-like beta-hydroxyacid dehydrogenase